MHINVAQEGEGWHPIRCLQQHSRSLQASFPGLAKPLTQNVEPLKPKNERWGKERKVCQSSTSKESNSVEQFINLSVHFVSRFLIIIIKATFGLKKRKRNSKGS